MNNTLEDLFKEAYAQTLDDYFGVAYLRYDLRNSILLEVFENEKD